MHAQDCLAAEMPNRLDPLLASGRKLLIGYFPACDPLVPATTIDVYSRCGVDVLEIGIQAANPLMDGEVVTSSMARSLGRGELEDAGEAIGRIRARRLDVATLVFAYYNEFSRRPPPAAWDGIDGLLGLPAAEGVSDGAIRASAGGNGVRIAEFVPFAFGPSDLERARNAQAYVMLQAAPGRTGARDALDPGCAERIRRLRGEGVTAGIVLGFGISRPEHAAQAVAMGADGVVVGSRCVDKCLEGESALADFLQGMRSGLDG
jgi:tryptophan synthase alpha chain